jgi:DNA (cytosine-5)-methyltransferase 1
LRRWRVESIVRFRLYELVAGVLTVGSLFSGIGGLDLGLERAGMSVVWQCEADPYCRAVLRKQWPGIPCYEDVRTIGAELRRVDLLCGGFPCQTVSSAARGRNVHPWLWPEFARLIRVLGPRYVLVENVAGHLSRERRFGEILRDLAALGFDAEWSVVPASEVGAPHQRARLWLVGYAHGDGQSNSAHDAKAPRLSKPDSPIGQWPDPPRGLGVAHGVPYRLDRLRALGNAVVPPVAEWIGRRIIEAEEAA